MPDYYLSGLSSRSFERLIQAIAAKVLGPGTVTFGDGPDGGREATFEGRMPFPSNANRWDGYCVIQAKFLQKPQGPKRDGPWLLKQLDKELRAFSDRAKGRRKPTYYILATNVALTAARDRGSKDRVGGVFRKYRKSVPIRDWRVWDFDEIGKFIDGFSDIRTAYAAWVTPGDVLHEVMQQLAGRRADFLDVITSFLARELLSDQYANLEQAGHAVEERIPLARVFVDLPVTQTREAEPPDEGSTGSKAGVTQLVADLISVSSDRLDPASTIGGVTTRSGSKALSVPTPEPGRYVLVGGPGQGKTTVGQFLCQVFRCALLQDRPKHSLPSQAHAALLAVSSSCEATKLALPKSRRFPVRVTLSDFAAALNADRELSLISYLARVVARRTGRPVTSEDLRAWLGNYPWLLVLDGLDEVPASTNRDQVLNRVEEFWVDAAQVNADILVLATTRPQGYSDDFSPSHYKHLWLAPLSTARAQTYAKRLVEVRYSDDVERQRKILTRLKHAASHRSTARLMRSPLQITIMATLVDQTGPPPQDRWHLFHDYYEVIYNRERERPIPAAELLRDHRADIDAIHSHTALLLQMESERAGGTEARLSVDRFAAVVNARLQEEGHKGADLERLRERVIEAAANRLVFLVGIETGQVGFEIRSLQEFMAAQAIMAGREASVQARMRQIAAIASWRNVFLFCAGRCFVRDQHLRDTVYTICSESNQDDADPVSTVSLAGSALALELIEDGVARRQPKFARLLTETAARVLELPPSDLQVRLADVCDGEAGAVVRTKLEPMLRQEAVACLGAWTTLLRLVDRDLGWAMELADQRLPRDPEEGLRVLLSSAGSGHGTWFLQRLSGFCKLTEPLKGYRRAVSRVRGFETVFMPAAIREGVTWGTVPLSFSGTQSAEMRFHFVAIRSHGFASRWSSFDPDEYHESWVPWLEGLRFSTQPSKELLGETLSNAARAERAFETGGIPRSFFLPWVYEACLLSARSPADLRMLGDRAAHGDLGDTHDWVAAERRWSQAGVSVSDLQYMTDDVWPFDRLIARHGFPISSSVLVGGGVLSDWCGQVLELLQSLEGAANTRLRAALVPSLLWRVLSSITQGHDASKIDPTQLQHLADEVEEIGVPQGTGGRLAVLALRDARWLSVADVIGSRLRSLGGAMGVHRERLLEEHSAALAELVGRNPDRRGLLNLLAAECMWTRPKGLSNAFRTTFEGFDDDRLRRSALVLEVAIGEFARERAVALAAETARLTAAAGLNDVLRAVRVGEQPNGAAAVYLIELYASLQASAAEERAAVLEALNDLLRRRTSRLDEPGVWESLGLPPALVSFMARGTSVSRK